MPAHPGYNQASPMKIGIPQLQGYSNMFDIIRPLDVRTITPKKAQFGPKVLFLCKQPQKCLDIQIFRKHQWSLLICSGY
jgi:hypothetical protein